MRRCVVKVKALDSSGIGFFGFRFPVSGVSKPPILKPETLALNTDLVAAKGLHWAI